MGIGGYAGRIVYIDLSSNQVDKRELDQELIKRFLGGQGINFWLAYKLIKPEMDAYAEEAPIIIGSGPIVGLPVPASSRVFATFKHPNYGGVIESSHAGGDFGPMLKWAGYDFLVIAGKSQKPVYITIRNEDISILDGNEIWGKDLYETTDTLWKRHDNACVFAIGPAGERMVKSTVGLIDKVHSLGKGGLPAVMGSKKLKAIVVNGTKGLEVFDHEILAECVMPKITDIKQSEKTEFFIDYGSMAGFPVWFERQGASKNNWKDTFSIEKAEQLYGVDLYKKEIKKNRIACFGCPVGCKDYVQLSNGEFEGLQTFGSSFYGRVENIAARCQVGSFNRVVKVLDYCQRMGLCVHDITAIIDWAIDLYNQNIISKEETGGLALNYDFETTMILLEQTACNTGFGKILGDGLLSAINTLGEKTRESAVHVKGMPPLYDARINRLNTSEFGQIVFFKGAHPGRANISELYMTRDLPNASEIARSWAERNKIPSDAKARIFDGPKRYNIGRLTKWIQERNLLFNSLGIGCSRARGGHLYGIDDAIKIYYASTGIEVSKNYLFDVASRSFNLLKALNFREGFTRKDDKFPERWFEPVTRHGKKTELEDYFGKKLNKADCEVILDEYYEENGWNIQNGSPDRKRLIEVGLEDVANDLNL